MKKVNFIHDRLLPAHVFFLPSPEYYIIILTYLHIFDELQSKEHTLART